MAIGHPRIMKHFHAITAPPPQPSPASGGGGAAARRGGLKSAFGAFYVKGAGIESILPREGRVASPFLIGIRTSLSEKSDKAGRFFPPRKSA